MSEAGARRGSLENAVLVTQACLMLDQASNNHERKEAEEFLLSFRQSANPYSICKHILDKSGVPSAQFHAVATLRDAILREWTLFSNQDIATLRDELVSYQLSIPSFLILLLYRSLNYSHSLSLSLSCSLSLSLLHS